MRQVGHYTLIEEIGRGGQATVFLAEDSRLKRKVALKLLSEQASTAAETLERFRREAEVASRLDHPGICAVYEAGVESGTPFIAMRLLDGETLARRIARLAAGEGAGSESSSFDTTPTTSGAITTPSRVKRRLSRAEIEEAAAIVEKTARALHAAHELGIIHRDIKPANVMITREGEPVVLDLGLARDEGADHQTLTRTGDVFGTPAYMSPEQLTGQRIRADRRTDVYALGATLFEAVTLRRPFEAPTREALYQAILTENPPDPRRINPRIPVELKVVMETALEKNRNRRYQTALALAEDLARVRKHEPIRARPAGPLLRLRRWVQRRPATAAIIAGAVVAVTLLAYALGASGKARLAERVMRHTEAENDRFRHAGLDEQLGKELAEYESYLGTVVFGAPYILGKDQTIDYKPLARRYLASFEAFGMPLAKQGGSAESLRTLEELRARNRPLWSTVTLALDDFAYLLGRTGAHQAGAEPALAAADREVAAVRQAIQPDTFEQSVRAAEAAWLTRGVDSFAPLLAEKELAARSASDLARLAGALYEVPERQPQAVELLDRALEKDPSDYGLHVWRGGVALMRAQTEQDPAEIERAHVHYQIARALRPTSGLAHMLLGVSTVLRGDYQKGLALVDRATELQSDSAIIWLMAADFYRRGPLREKALAAARKAYELDPSLARARELLAELEGAETRER